MIFIRRYEKYLIGNKNGNIGILIDKDLVLD